MSRQPVKVNRGYKAGVLEEPDGDAILRRLEPHPQYAHLDPDWLTFVDDYLNRGSLGIVNLAERTGV